MRFEQAYEGWQERRLTQEEAAYLLGVHERTFPRTMTARQLFGKILLDLADHPGFCFGVNRSALGGQLDDDNPLGLCRPFAHGQPLICTESCPRICTEGD